MSTKTQGSRHHHSHHQGHANNENPSPAKQKVGEDERSRLIEVRAYGLWEQAGKPDGDAARQRFWCEAEKEIASQSKNE